MKYFVKYKFLDEIHQLVFIVEQILDIPVVHLDHPFACYSSPRGYLVASSFDLAFQGFEI